MKVLYFGGQKSGKSLIAEQKAIESAGENKPYYIATYDNSYKDKEMQNRISKHQSQREEKFITMEEPRELLKNIQANQTYLIDCISMWILNTIDESLDILLKEIEAICLLDTNIVFVLNDVNSGIIPAESISRRFVDRSGIIGQALASYCDEIYEVKLGLKMRLK